MASNERNENTANAECIFAQLFFAGEIRNVTVAAEILSSI
jgi:hypothetical protein